MKKYRNRIIAGIFVAIILIAVYWWGGNSPGLHGWEAEPAAGRFSSESSENVGDGSEHNAYANRQEEKSSETQTTKTDETIASPDGSKAPQMSEKDNQQSQNLQGSYSQTTEDIQKVDPQSAETAETALLQQNEDGIYYCTISVNCSEILKHMDWLKPEKRTLIPADGIILPQTKAVFYEGETIFNVLQRELKKAKIHLEFSKTPLYNSVYIEGIYNLYEFDCGEQSGWMYSVNGTFPNYGSSRYFLKNGDTIEWTYTCDFGRDVGDYYIEGEAQTTQSN